jgi:hypothetical protein
MAIFAPTIIHRGGCMFTAAYLDTGTIYEPFKILLLLPLKMKLLP